MKRFYNIQAGYDLSQRAVDATYGILKGFDYFEDFVDSTELQFVKSVAKPMKNTLYIHSLKICKNYA